MMESWELRVIDSPSHLTSIRSFIIFPKISLIWKSVISSINLEFYSLNPLITQLFAKHYLNLRSCVISSQSTSLIFSLKIVMILFYQNQGKKMFTSSLLSFMKKLWTYLSHSKTVYISFNQIVVSFTNLFHTKIFIDLS